MNATIACRGTSLLLLSLFALLSCKKTLQQRPQEELISAARSTPGELAATTTSEANANCEYVFSDNALLSAGWTKTFEDNFDANLSNWNIWTGGAYNNELQYYQASNLQLSNGSLVITAKKETVTGRVTPYDRRQKTFSYTSGRIECKTNVSANSTTPKVRMVARIKLPAGYGMWAAFWSYGDPWPTQGEIDMVEARGQEPKKYQTNYFYGQTRNRNLVTNGEGVIHTDGDLTSCYHVYEMEWAQNTLTSYLDGVVVETKSGGYISNLFGKTERITLNLAVGGDFFNNLNPAQIMPGTMFVDYVKVFTSNK
jgi:beta-glucanase (GH16 family)